MDNRSANVASSITLEGVAGIAPEDRTGISGLPHDIEEQRLRRNFEPAAMMARRQLPSVPLLPVPDFCRTLVATGVNYVQEIQLPRNVQVVMFRALSTDRFWVSFAGRVPATPATGSLDGDFSSMDPIVCPLDLMFYCRGLQTLSINIAAAGAAVTVIGWDQL